MTFKSNATRHAFTLAPLAVALSLAGPALAQTNDTSLAFDANIEIDSDVLDRKGEDTEHRQGGRLELNAFGEHRVGDYFVRGRATALLLKDGDTATDDMWGMVGTERWDVQIGRFEGYDLFPKGKDTIVEHAGVAVYEANGARGRASDGGQLAVHFHPTDTLSFELGTLYGEGDSTTAFSGVRPAVSYAGPGGFIVTAGYEHVEFDNEVTTRELVVEDVDGTLVVNEMTETVTAPAADFDGYGLTLGFELAGALVNLNAAHKDDNLGNDVTTLGANVIYGPFGFGYINSREDVDSGSDPQVDTFYAAYTVPLLALENASVTFAATTSSTNDAGGDDELHGGRVRFNYAF